MTEYTGRTARISGDLLGEVVIRQEPPQRAFRVVVDPADLLGWLRAQGMPMVQMAEIATAVQSVLSAWIVENGVLHETDAGDIAEAVVAALSTTTTTKEGESDVLR